MHDSYSLGEIAIGLIGVLLTLSFGGWAAVVKRSADQMAGQIERVIGELSALREEIHRDRLANEKRFIRIESKVGISDVD